MMNIFTDNPDFLEVLNSHLRGCIERAAKDNQISGRVEGVFSLDDLENKADSAISMGFVAFGVAYLGCEPTPPGRDSQEHKLVANTTGAGMLTFKFIVLIGARADSQCSQRTFFEKVLSMVRKEVFQSRVQYGKRQEMTRAWMLERERPETADSTETVLYYSQVWSINLPVTSKQQGD